MKKGNKRHRLKKQKSALNNIEMIYKSRNDVIKFFDDYASMISEAKNKAAKGIGIKILTSKKILQRLPITLVQINPGNNSEYYIY